MDSTFRVGVTPDFYLEVKGKFEAQVESKLGNLGWLSVHPMPPQAGNVVSAASLNDYDAVLSLAIGYNRDSVSGVERTALISRWGVGYDMLDVDALTANDIALAITPGAVRRPVSDAILAMIFALSSNLVGQDRLVRSGKWRGDLSRLGQSPLGRTLGSLGCGNIAQQLFRSAQSIGFGRFIAHDPYVSPDVAGSLGVELVSIEDLFVQSDYLCVNTPLGAATRGIVDAGLLRRMKPTAYFINTARGAIVRQAALTQALQEGWIAGAGLDVFEVEPLPPDDPLRQLDNVILAPHGLAWTEELARDNSLEACDNILAVARGEVPAAIVNKDVLQRPGFRKKLERYRRKV
jgi:phosphoglycerate dehydrogenase-like enzyme